MWILATLASIIASQALISAAFQIIKQAVAQGFFPRFTIIHTSKKVSSAPLSASSTLGLVLGNLPLFLPAVAKFLIRKLCPLSPVGHDAESQL